MSELEKLRAEVSELRQQVESYRLFELEALRSQLAEARAQAQHYRSEAERNAELGRQIHREAQEEMTRLRTKIQAQEALPNARVVPNVGRGAGAGN
jgi:multidrug resistance efflux pump